MKKIWLAGMLMLACMCAIAKPPAEMVTKGDELVGWMERYYLKPTPSLFIVKLKSASDQGVLAEQFRWNTLIGFIAGVIKNNPQLSTPLADLIVQVPDKERQPLLMGLFYGGHQKSSQALQQLSGKLPAYKNGIERFLSQPIADVTKMFPLEDNAGAIDVNWGYFMATGEFKPLQRIMSAMPWRHLKDDGTAKTKSKILIGRLALGSIQSKMRTSSRISMLCQQAIKTQPKEIADELRLIVPPAGSTQK